MAGAFRESSIRALCDVCRADADAPCLRCGRPLCHQHGQPDDRRCDACERDFLHRRTGDQIADLGWLILGISLLGAFAVVALYTTGAWLADPFAIAGAVAGGIGAGASYRGRRALMPAASRRRFLKERKVKQLADRQPRNRR